MLRRRYSNKIIVLTIMIAFIITMACKSTPASTPEPESASKYGLIFADEEAYAAIPLAPLYAGATSLPARFSLEHNFPTAGDQGEQGSCVGWAVAYALKTYQEAQERGWSPNVLEHQFSPAYVYNQIIQKSRKTCHRGTTVAEALDLIKNEGVAPLSYFGYDEYNCSRLPSNRVRQIASTYAIKSYSRVCESDCDSKDLEKIKISIAGGDPVVIEMLVNQDFRELSGNTIWRSSKLPPVGHAVVVVGYDDSKHAFRIINSWGTDWGDRGYGWIAYNTFSKAVVRAYVVEDIIDNKPPPTPIEPTREPPTTCSISVYPPFESVWLRKGGAAVSCPTGNAFTRNGAYQYFQNGLMLWHAGPRGDAGGMIYVVYNNGNWQEYADHWVEGQNERSCSPTPPANLFVPKRGFGKIWCEKLGGANAKIGWATNNEQSTPVTVQPFEGTGVIISFPNGTYFLPHSKYWK